mmetsp:Transcript_10602/g.26737  ORF Transcript_10602/g.26737 Transcript_10602/m.26737 type:complete len:262 (-) Transcript_10602:51-836(-)
MHQFRCSKCPPPKNLLLPLVLVLKNLLTLLVLKNLIPLLLKRRHRPLLPKRKLHLLRKERNPLVIKRVPPLLLLKIVLRLAKMTPLLVLRLKTVPHVLAITLSLLLLRKRNLLLQLSTRASPPSKLMAQFLCLLTKKIPPSRFPMLPTLRRTSPRMLLWKKLTQLLKRLPRTLLHVVRHAVCNASLRRRKRKRHAKHALKHGRHANENEKSSAKKKKPNSKHDASNEKLVVLLVLQHSKPSDSFLYVYNQIHYQSSLSPIV